MRFGVAHDGEVDIQGSTGSHQTKNYRSDLHPTGSADTILEILLFGWCTVHSVPDIGEYEALFMRGLVDAGAILAVGFVATQTVPMVILPLSAPFLGCQS